MTVTDCHHEKTAVQKREPAKNFRFWERFANDRHPLFFHYVEEKKISRTKNENFSRLQSFYEIGNLQLIKKTASILKMLAVIVIFVCFYLSN